MIRTSLLVSTLLFSMSAFACNTDYNIDVQTHGEGVTVELRSGVHGSSTVVASRKTRGGNVSFTGLCAGMYFLAIGNDEYVDATQPSYFQDYMSYSGQITITYGSGNVDKRSRGSL